MNIHSLFIEKYIIMKKQEDFWDIQPDCEEVQMSNQKDEEVKEMTKLEKIKLAAISVISKKGFSNTSVADIATEANVSVGYLYRHYDGKLELVHDIIVDMYRGVLQNTKKILDRCETAEAVCDQVIRYHFKVYSEAPEKIMFLVMLINDFGIYTYNEQRKYLTEICQEFYDNFIEKKGVREHIAIDEVYIALVVIPLQSFSFRLRQVFVDNSRDEDIVNMIKNISLKIVQA